MIRPRSVAGLAGGCALIAIVNAVVLGSAAWNRGAEHPVRLTLTERELALPEFREDDSSGLFLEFRFAGQAPPAVRRAAWRRQHVLPFVDFPWLDAAKLRELGFRLDPPGAGPTDDHDHTATTTRRAFVVLEFEGDAWTRLLTVREERVAAIRDEAGSGAAEPQALADAEAVLNLDRIMRSRLVPIDAGFDEEELRARYAGKPGTVIVEAVVGAVREGAETDDASWRGEIQRLVIADVRVPAELRPAMTAFLPAETEAAASRRERAERQVAWPAPVSARYRATVAFGRRNEPWLVGVEAIRDTPR